METIKSYYNQRFARDDDVCSVVTISTSNQYTPIIDGFDLLVLIVSKYRKPINYISHYIKEGVRIQERWIHKDGLDRWILNGENRSIIQWILMGDILFDKKSYLADLRQCLSKFEQSMRKKKLFIEFSLFLRRYLQGRDYIEQGQTLDAYNSVLEALQHWGRICIVESGRQPEVMVWKQLKQINLGVYKLYEELTLSLETLEERVQLVLLACEFSVMSKMEQCCEILFEVLDSREEPWSANELKYHPELIDLHVELALVLNKLQSKALIEEVKVPFEDELNLFELKYKSSGS